METVWMKRYPPGVPPEIDPDRLGSLAALFEASCKKFADYPAFTNFGTTMTYDRSQIKKRGRKHRHV